MLEFAISSSPSTILKILKLNDESSILFNNLFFSYMNNNTLFRYNKASYMNFYESIRNTTVLKKKTGKITFTSFFSNIHLNIVEYSKRNIQHYEYCLDYILVFNAINKEKVKFEYNNLKNSLIIYDVDHLDPTICSKDYYVTYPHLVRHDSYSDSSLNIIKYILNLNTPKTLYVREDFPLKEISVLFDDTNVDGIQFNNFKIERFSGNYPEHILKFVDSNNINKDDLKAKFKQLLEEELNCVKSLIFN